MTIRGRDLLNGVPKETEINQAQVAFSVFVGDTKGGSDVCSDAKILGPFAWMSLSNAALSIVIARTVSPTEYGAFALAFSIYTLAVAVSGSITGPSIPSAVAAGSPTLAVSGRSMMPQ